LSNHQSSNFLKHQNGCRNNLLLSFTASVKASTKTGLPDVLYAKGPNLVRKRVKF